MAIWVNETHVGGTIEPLRVAKVVLEARVTLFKSVNFKAAWSLSQNIFVYKFSVQENLYYHNKLQQQTAQILIAVCENIPYGMRIWEFAISTFSVLW